MSGHGHTCGAGVLRHTLVAVRPVAPQFDAVRAAWRLRRERLWLGLVAVPLAEVATGLIGEWWAWPVLLVGAWACLRTWHWYWVLSLELGGVGVMWAMNGANALARYPDDLLVVGAVWVSFPIALAMAGIVSRRRRSRPEAYFPLR